MKIFRHAFLLCVLFATLVLCSCGPFGVGPWYAIYQSTQKDDDDVGVVRITYGPELSTVTNNSATIEWVTDIQSDSTVQYGPDSLYGSQEKDAALDTVHSVTLTGLASNTTYHFRVLSVAGNGAVGASADCEFTTKVSLTIASAYGPTTPDVGTWYYDSGEDVFATAPENVAGPAKTRYRCTGCTGTGSAPDSTESSTFFTITQDSTLTWNWVTQYYVTTTTNPIGSGSVTCSPLGNWHDDGTSPEVTATGNAGYGFINWTGDMSGSNNPETLVVNAPKTVVANFTGETFTLTVNSAYGSPDPSTGPHLCASGANIDASVASPVSGGAGVRYVCTGWTGTGDVDPTGTTNSTNFTITQNSSITWNWKTQYQLTTNVDPVGGGTVSRNPDATWYDDSTVVDLTATPEATFSFNNWTGDPVVNPDFPATPETVEITMDSAKSVTAHFTGGGPFWTLTVSSAYGTPDPPTSSVADGTLVDASVDSPVAGTPGIRYVCTGWSGTGDVDPTGTTNSTSFTMTQDSSITWNWKTQYRLITSVAPVGGGTIERNPDATWYDDGTGVELTAEPSPSYVFDSWSGDLSGATNPDSVTMNGPKSVTATFITTTFTLTVNSAYGNPDPSTGSNPYTSGTNVTATVESTVDATTPGVRYVCTGYDGTGSVNPPSGSTNSVNFDITEDSSITWNWKTQYELATAVSPLGAGSVQLVPSGGWYDPSTGVELTAIIDASYNFTSWSGDLSGSTNPENLTMDSPKSVTANCELKATVIRVPGDYGTIQEAIDACSIGGTVLVADDTYTGLGNKDLDFKGKAITVISENGPENCIIDCQNSGRGFDFHSDEQADSVLDGFTIKNGNATDGGGIRCRTNYLKPTITNCIITDCTVSGKGGGIFCDHANPTITNCTIANNSANYGGGIHVLYCTSVIKNCIISGNTAQNYGGGIDCYISTGRPKISNCIITDNSVTSTSSGYGGGGVASRYNAKPELTNCLIASNTAGYYGGGLYCNGADFVMTNCTVSGNSAGRGGGVVSIDSTPELRNCIIWYNDATITANEMLISASTLTADYCDFRDDVGCVAGTVTETNCIHTDPLFASAAGGNFRLLSGSPCINSGSNTYANPGDKDLDGRDRIIDTTVDIGAYELGGLNVPSAYLTIQEAIDAAETGDTVVVADGTYQGTGNKDLDFKGKLIVVSSESGPAGCIIDCETSGRGFNFHSGETLGSVVAGFTITNGDIGIYRGGAIYCDNSSPTITNCTLESNSARRGGAVACRYNNCTVLISNCTIDSNSALYGGGIWCESSAAPTIENCLIANNTADNNGGAVYCDGASFTITNCLISDNEALSPGMGGGVYCLDCSTEGTITNSTIASNQGRYGGGIACNNSVLTATNTIIWGNRASENGNQVYSQASAAVTLNYCDFANGAGDIVESSGGTVTELGGCIYSDPLFASAAGGNFRLMPGSPCINSGSNTYVNPGDKDLDGRDRIIDTTVDMGAYELGGLKVPSEYSTIQDAIDAAETGDTVVVADGTYQGTGNKDLDFKGKLIVVSSENGPANCIIDCETSGRGFYFHSGETAGSVVSGFTIKNGSTDEDGGGIYTDNSSPTISNCAITNCLASSNGGGIYCDSSSLEILDCVISNNSSTGGNAGGIFCGGSTSSSPTIRNCRITNNSANNSGGAVLCGVNASPAITNCLIADNSAGGNGGGIYCTGDPTITNCTIVNNSAADNGGGIRSYFGADPTVRNSIVWGNTANTGSQINGVVTVLYSDVQGGWTGTGNIDTDPMFVSVAGANFRLLPGSPCINTGDNSYVNPGDKDLDGRDRIIDTTVDIGAYELGGLNVPSAYSTIQEAIDAAQTGDTVIVADGTYQGTGNKDLDFKGKLIVVCSENGAAGCIIDCETSGRGFYFHSGETLGSVVAGFTITNGDIGIYRGGAIYCDNSSPTIMNCEIVSNSTNRSGGGICCCNSASPVFRNCLIASNTSGENGGGVYCDGNSSCTLTNCTVANNSGYAGAGIALDNLSTATLQDTIIWQNGAKNQNYVKDTISTSEGQDINSISAADIDSDGDADLFGVKGSQSDLYWWEKTVSGWTRHTITTTGANKVASISAVDVDNDGDMDLYGVATEIGDLYWWENDGSQSFTRQLVSGTEGNKINCIAAADIDGDGDGDFFGLATELSDLYWWENTGSGWTRHTISTFEGNNVEYIAAGDIDGDGDTDFYGVNPSGSDLYWWENDGSQSFTKRTITTFEATDVNCISAADIDGDGDSDCFGLSTSKSDLYWWEKTDSGWTRHTITTIEAANVECISAGDIDIDNDIDLYGVNPSQSRLYWWEDDSVSKQVYAANSSTATADYCCLPTGGASHVSPDVTQTSCINSNPLFVVGPKGDYYLDHTTPSPCVNAGSDTAASLGLDTRTTRTDEVTDTGTVDIGYHYDP